MIRLIKTVLKEVLIKKLYRGFILTEKKDLFIIGRVYPRRRYQRRT